MRWARGFSVSAIVLVMLPSTAPAQVERPSGWDEDRTLSPYFEIQGVPGVDHLPLTETTVDVHVSGVIAAVVVRQVYENRGARPIHAKYVFPASTRAAVNGLRMRIGPRIVEAVIREKERAREEYERAKKEGRNAALLEQVRPNVFDMRVANIMPGDRIEVELRYTELLVPEENTYEFVYPTVVGPRYTEGSRPVVAASRSVAEDRVGPAFASTNGGPPPPGPVDAPIPLSPGPSSEAGAEWTSTSHLREPSGSPWRFDMNVTINAGMPLRWISVPSHEVEVDWNRGRSARISLDDSESHGANRDYILRYRMAGEKVSSGLMVHRGQRENFFLLMVEPPERVTPESIPPREFIFVVDVSGSMRGFPLDTSKELLRDLVGGLRSSDSFNVLLFSGATELFSPASLPATPDNVRRALRFIEHQRGGGGTRLPAALIRALDLPRHAPGARSFVVLTDGYISAEAEAFRIARERRDDANVFAFGIGSSVNRYLVEGLARAGMSTPFVVTEPGEATEVGARFREYVSAPVLTDVRVDFGPVDVYDVAPRAIPDVLADRPVVIYGKFRGETAGTMTLRGHTGTGEYEAAFALDGVPVDGSSALRYLWARRTIAQLSDPATSGGDEDTRREAITRLGLEYSLLTPYTSFIAVDRIVRNPDGGGSDVEQAQPLPEGMEAPEAGRPMGVGAEPDLRTLLLALLGVLLVRAALARREPSRKAADA